MNRSKNRKPGQFQKRADANAASAPVRLLKKQDGESTEFREGLWTGLLDYATIYANGQMTFTFKVGMTIDG